MTNKHGFEVQVGRAFCSTFSANVDVIRVYEKSGTVTLRVRGGGLRAGELMTFRGISADTLSAPRKAQARRALPAGG